ncbi:MAG: glutamine synthetase type III, partial [Bacteroidota bacterium]|nr:glutamine synthetase type III [Bacteroidota bacterium]
MAELATSHILPAAIRYQNLLVNNIKGLKEVGLAEDSYANQMQILQVIADHVNSLSDLVEQMIEARKKCNTMKNTRKMALAYCTDVKEKFFDQIRYHADKLELLVDDKEWSLPKYRELLFLR